MFHSLSHLILKTKYPSRLCVVSYLIISILETGNEDSKRWGNLTEGRKLCWHTHLFLSLCSFPLMLHPFSVALSHFTIKQTPTWSSVSRPNVPFSRKSSLTSLGRIVFSCLCAPKTPRSFNNWAVISCLHVSLSHQTASGAGLYLMHFHVLHSFFLTCSLGKCFMREWMNEWMNPYISVPKFPTMILLFLHLHLFLLPLFICLICFTIIYWVPTISQILCSRKKQHKPNTISHLQKSRQRWEKQLQ